MVSKERFVNWDDNHKRKSKTRIQMTNKDIKRKHQNDHHELLNKNCGTTRCNSDGKHFQS